jgi:uncharacterized integral membrane protein (TIGR00698 family)
MKKIKNIFELIPGILFLFIIGLISKNIGNHIPYISYLIIAIGLGIIFANLFDIPTYIEKGIKKTHKLWLETGIVILGARIIFVDLLKIGSNLLWMIIGFIIFGLVSVESFSHIFKVDDKLGSCLASGTSVCGVSAVIATGGAINATKDAIAYAIATVLTFDVITVFLYPILGEIFSIPAQVYGPWAGISMFSTGTTVAAGFAHSDTAGQLATICKMGRNVFIGGWALLYSLYYIRKGLGAQKVTNKTKYLWSQFPKAVIGFIIIMVMANIGLLTNNEIGYMKNAYNWLFMMAFVGMGYTLDINKMKNTGIKPFLIVSIAFILISISSLIMSFTLFA